MNNKKILSVFFIILVIVGGYFYYRNKNNASVSETKTSYKDATYTVEGEKVSLKNGLSSVQIPNSSAEIITQYFGNEVDYDFNSDGKMDKAFLLTQNGGGTGTFYYLVAAIQTETGFDGSEAVFIGDRIAPQTTVVDGKKIIVNFADRDSGDSFTEEPTVGKSLAFLLDVNSMQFGTVEIDFSGEADPNRMSLGMKTWVWQKAEYNDGKVVIPKQPGKFSLTFSDNSKFTAKTDCNSMGGEYSVNKEVVTFKNIYSTKMFCEGSQETDFAKILETTGSYHFTGKGELILDLKFDSGSVTFN